MPVEDFTRNLILSTAGMIIFVCLLSLVLAQVFVRPLRRLKLAAQRIAAGRRVSRWMPGRATSSRTSQPPSTT